MAEPLRKFFNGRRLRCFLTMKAPKRNKNLDRQIEIGLRIALDGNTIRSGPDQVKMAYEEVRGQGAHSVKLKLEIEGVNAEFYALDTSKRVKIQMSALTFTALEVLESSNASGDSAIMLTMSAERDWDSVLWEYLGDAYKTDVFVEFDAAQATLMDAMEGTTEAPPIPSGKDAAAGETGDED